MTKAPEISWRQLTGNKFRKDLLPEMLTDAGHFKQQNIRRIGEPKSTIFNVVYDKEYFMQILVRKVCKPLSTLGREKVISLVNEAWDLYDKECLTPHGLASRSN